MGSIKNLVVRPLILLSALFVLTVRVNAEPDAELILRKTEITLNRGKITTSNYFEIKINNRNGEKYTRVSIPWSKLSKVSNLVAEVRDNSGRTVRRLKPSEVTDRSRTSYSTFYHDEFLKEFTLRHNTYPFTIVYSWESASDQFFAFDYWLPVLAPEVPTIKATLAITVPDNEKIVYRGTNIGNPEVVEVSGTITCKWQTSYDGRLREEYFSPYPGDLMPFVVALPYRFLFDKPGSFGSWDSFGSWQREVMKGLDNLPDYEKKKVDQIISGSQTTEDKVRNLYHYLQDNTRYVNVVIETGGMKPYPASYVAQNRYGDCKALTNYFRALLSYAGIESFYTLVHAGDVIRDIDPRFPAQLFNHIILMIPDGKDTLWLDCTSKGPFGYLGTFTQNRYALAISDDRAVIVRTPAMHSEHTHELRTFTVNYEYTDQSAVKMKGLFRGDMFEQLTGIDSQFGETDKERIVREYFTESGFELRNYSISRMSRDSREVILEYDALTKSLYSKYGNEIIVNTIPFDIPAFERPEERKTELLINYPIAHTDTVKYSVPFGYKPAAIGGKVNIISEFGSYSRELHIKEDGVTIVKSLMIKSGRFPLVSYPEFYRFIKEVKDEDTNAVAVLTKTITNQNP